MMIEREALDRLAAESGATPQRIRRAMAAGARSKSAPAAARFPSRVLADISLPNDNIILDTRTFSLALLVFSSPFAAFPSATDIRPANLLSYVVIGLLIALFAFLAAGWALLVVSIAVGWALCRVAVRISL